MKKAVDAGPSLWDYIEGLSNALKGDGWQDVGGGQKSDGSAGGVRWEKQTAANNLKLKLEWTNK